MIQKIKLFIGVIVIASTCVVSAFTQAKKHALIIAIGDYPTDGDWPDISSQNDIAYVYSTLHVLGYKDTDISIISDSMATKKGILQAFQSLSNKINPSDHIYIHYSGHGQQVLDQNGDEIDGLDEALVPYDSPLYYSENSYHGENLLRDDEIAIFTQKWRTLCGPMGKIFLVIDACHSGTATRGIGKARGTNYIMSPNQGASTYTSIPRHETSLDIITEDDLAPMASFFGSSPQELNYETFDPSGHPVGSLTYTLSEVIRTSEADASIDQIFKRIKHKMNIIAPRQIPQFEGNGALTFFDNQDVHINKNHFLIIDVIDSLFIQANGGQLDGIYTGSKVSLYSQGSKTPLCKGEVIQSQLTKSTIHLDNPIERSALDQYYIRIDHHAIPEQQIFVYNQIEENHTLYPYIIDALQRSALTLSKKHSELCVKILNNEILLLTKEGNILFQSNINTIGPEETSEALFNAVTSYMQCQFLRKYESPTDHFDFSITVNIVDCQEINHVKSTQPDEIVVGDCMQFIITNNGVNGAYYSVLDVQPDNAINIIIPAIELGYTADEYYLASGQTYKTNYPIQIGHPLGQEVIKLFVSKKPMHLHQILSTKGTATRQITQLTAFEQALVNTYGDHFKNTKPLKNTEEKISTKTIYFDIVE